jgi:hypothetical protein
MTVSTKRLAKIEIVENYFRAASISADKLSGLAIEP